ncbi:hypothetical protein BDV25DRAFT_138908 [Aspergillus avenaceus]|uniref:Nuclear fusion protein KAR5 n=1 Tax=Aspergillus avenaceus TaxID=36643 RepID=A0A5N6TYJ3_ASPAV|nr:hypothetical protein BDV25DRAFT_138908 [Aspergillus avenaceus]
MKGLSYFTAFTIHTLLLCCLLLPIPSSAENDLIPNQNDSVGEADLVSFLTSKTENHDAIFTEAVQILRSLKSSPTCNYFATSKLVTSCQSIGGKDRTLDADKFAALEHSRSLYATRLAICELNGAGTSVPPSCLPVTASPPQKKRIFTFATKSTTSIDIFEPNSAQLLEACLKSLEARPQWWTSYSNSRQNAFIICQAARIENEKEELLHLHSSIIQSSIKLDRGLQEALRKAAAESSQYKAFTREILAMNSELILDLEKTQSRFKTFFKQIQHELETSTASIVNAATSVLGRIQAKTTIIEQDMQNVSSSVGQMQRAIRDVFDEIQSGNEQIASIQQQHVLTHNELALALQSRMKAFVQDDMDRLSQSIGMFDASLEWLYGRLGLLVEQELGISERLHAFESVLEDFTVKAEAIHRVQQQQLQVAEAQAILHDKVQTSVKISQALLEKVAAASADLQVMVDETAARYKGSPALSGLLGHYTNWTLYGLVLPLIGSQNPKTATIMLAIGVVYLLTVRLI